MRQAANWTNIWNAQSHFLSVLFQRRKIMITSYTGYTYVAYCFAPVAGYSSFGSYTGNGSADGPFVYTGFRPALVLLKCS
jgi:hypothetical protein